MLPSFSPNNFIAEIGVNHENDMSLAKQMVRECAEAGIGCVKFQSYKSSKLAAPFSPSYWDTTKESTTSQSELFSKYDDFGEAEYHELYQYCQKVGIEFLSTPFDVDYVKALSPYVDRYKVASVDLTNYILLDVISEQKKPVILSVGASSIDEISDAVKFLSERDVFDLTLLHCIINYPTKIEHAGLGNIGALKKKFPNLKVGYSDHTVPEDSHVLLPLAVALGAEVIEKHYTFDKTLPGNDHYHSFDKDDLSRFVDNISSINKALGPADLEQQRKAISFARRGLYATKKMRAGDVITEKDLCPLRPQLDFISPKYFHDVIGKVLINNVDELSGISYSDIKDLEID